MKIVKNMLLAAIAAAGCTAPAMAVGNVVIAQIYGAGGNGGAAYRNDFVVLFNRSSTPQAIGDWSIQYASQTGGSWSVTPIPTGTTLAPGQYWLIQMASGGANGAVLPLSADMTSTINMGAASGKVALATNITPLGTAGTPVSCPIPNVNVEDFVQFGVAGGSGVCGEGGAPTGTALSTTTGAYRDGNGCVDTDVNANDFAAATISDGMFRNSSSTFNVCSSGGACCTGVSTCTLVANAGACSGGTYQGNGSVCSPNPCIPPQGSCCIPSSTTCTVNSQADCTSISGAWVSGGTCTPTNPCLGACCVGTTCTQTSSVGCSGFWTAAATCSPTFCPSELPGQAGDVAYGASVADNFDSAIQVRDVAGVGTRVGTWAKFNFQQSMEYDNSGGAHNANGNLLGLNFGSSAATGAILTNLSTNGTAAGQPLFQLDGTQYSLQASRAGGLSVSPDNTRLAMVATDAARVVVLNYSAGSSVGTGSGASITGGSQTDNLTFTFASGQTSGTAWLNNNELIVYINSSDIFSFVGPAIFTISVDGAGNLGTPVFRVAPTTTALGASSRFYGLSYNPSVSPYIYAASSSFVGTPAPGVSTSLISVIDPATWTELKVLDLSTSIETVREIAVGADRNLYIGQFAGSTFQPTSALIDRLDLDLDNNNVINAADTAGLTDNSSVNWYLKGTTQTTSSFNGLDVALTGTVTPTTGACCLISGTCSVTTSGACIGGTFQGVGTSCSPNPCPQPSTGRCCIGARCAITLSAACTGIGSAGVNFTAGASNCNANNIFNTPCCFADYNKAGGVTVQDIFDFLSDWFNNSPNANVAGDGVVVPSVQDIFDFLSAWFIGC